MTGFGRAAGTVGERFAISVITRSVNHRYLEVSVRVPEVFWELEPAIRSLASETFSRGKVDVTIRVSRTSDPDYEIRLARKIADRVLPELKALLEDFGLEAKLSASDLLRIPDLVQVVAKEPELEEGEQKSVLVLVGQAFEMLEKMRENEGKALQGDIESRLAEARSGFASLAELRETVQQESLQSYLQRVEELAKGAGVAMDSDRLAQETVIQVERGDIAEELSRAESHLRQMEGLMGSSEPAGKKLDFLSQELLREINTAGQKSRSAAMRSIVVELKTAVERIREQVQNVE